jgi:hypothetical protein
MKFRIKKEEVLKVIMLLVVVMVSSPSTLCAAEGEPGEVGEQYFQPGAAEVSTVSVSEASEPGSQEVSVSNGRDREDEGGDHEDEDSDHEQQRQRATLRQSLGELALDREASSPLSSHSAGQGVRSAAQPVKLFSLTQEVQNRAYADLSGPEFVKKVQERQERMLQDLNVFTAQEFEESEREERGSRCLRRVLCGVGLFLACGITGVGVYWFYRSSGTNQEKQQHESAGDMVTNGESKAALQVALHAQ